MTNTPDTPKIRQPRQSHKRLLRIILWSGLGLGTVALVGGVGATWWVKTQLAPTIENVLSDVLNREVEVGGLEGFGPGYLKFGPSSIPPTDVYPDHAKTDGVIATFPLGPLLSGKLKLDLTVLDSEVYLKQQPDGSFKLADIVQGEENRGENQFDVELNVDASQVKVEVQPMLQTSTNETKPTQPILLIIDKANLKLLEKLTRVLADVNGKFASGGTFAIDADGVLTGDRAKIAIDAQKVQLPELLQLANIPGIEIPTGEVNTNATVRINNRQLENLDGNVGFQDIVANINNLTKPVSVSGNTKLSGKKIIVETLDANYDDIAVAVTGDIGVSPNLNPMQTQFDLNANVSPVDFDTLLNLARDEIGLQLDIASKNPESAQTQNQLKEILATIESLKPMLAGEVKTDVDITGNISAPQIAGRVQTAEFTRIDRIGFSNIATNFQLQPKFDPQFQLVSADVSFSDLQVKPSFGGEITGSGAYKLTPQMQPDSQNSGSSKKLNFTPIIHRPSPLQAQVPAPPDLQIPQNLDLNVEVKDLPLGEIARRYGVQLPVPLGNLAAKVQVGGDIANLNGDILWQLTQGIYPVQGKINIANSQANIEEAIAKIGSGNVQIGGFANLENWQISADANRVPLNRLQPLEPLGIPPGLEGILNGKANLAGTTDNLTLNGINGSGSGKLDIASGSVNVAGKLENSRWQGNGNLSNLSLRELQRIAKNADFLPSETPSLFARRDAVVSGSGNFSGSVNNFTRITGNARGRVETAAGRINANSDFDNGRFRASVAANRLGLNPLLDLGVSALDSGSQNPPQRPLGRGENSLRGANDLIEQVERLKSVGGELTFAANASGSLDNLSPTAINADGSGKLIVDKAEATANGSLNRGNFRGNVKSDRIALSDLESIGKNLGFIPAGATIFTRRNDGQVEGRARVSGNLNNLTPEALNLDADGELIIAGGRVEASGEVNSGRFQGEVDSTKLAINPLLDIGAEILDSGAVELDRDLVNEFQSKLPGIKSLNSQISISGNASGNLNDLTANSITAKGNSQLIIDGQMVRATGRLNRGRFSAAVDTDTIALSSLEQTIRKTGFVELPADMTLPAAVSERNANINLNGNISGDLQNLTPEAIAADGRGVFRLGDSAVNARGSLNRGFLEARANADPIPLNFIEEIATELGLIPASFLPLKIDGEVEGQGQVAGSLNDLFRGAVSGNATGKLRLDRGGIVNLDANLQGQEWQTSVIANRVALTQFSELAEKQEAAAPAVDGIRQARSLLGQPENVPILTGLLDATVNASGSLLDFSPEAIAATANANISELPILLQPFETTLNWNGSAIEIEKATTAKFNANGIVAVNFGGETPEIGNINIDANISDFDFESLPQQQVLKTEAKILQGRLNFDGKVTGNLNTLQLASDVELRNLAINQIDFDPVLSGNLNAGINRGLDFQIAGKQDRIQAALDRGFFPSSFLISRDAAVARGEVRGNDLEVFLDDFPLQVFQIAPIPNVGVVSGIASANLTAFNIKPFDLESLRANGSVKVEKPSVGYVDADIFTGKIDYANNKGNLADGQLILGESKYLLDASVDLKPESTLEEELLTDNGEAGEFNPAFAAKLRVEKGDIQDILAALKWFSIKEIIGQVENDLATPVYGNAEDVETASILFRENAGLLKQMRRLAEIDALIENYEKFEEESSPVPLPSLSELLLKFDAEVTAQGSLLSGVDADFNLVGADWVWGRYQVSDFLVKGSYEDDVLRVRPLRVVSKDGNLSGFAILGAENFSGQVRVEKVPLEELQKFAKNLPPGIVDVKGDLNLETTMGGTWKNPQAIGDIVILDGTINGEPIKRARSAFSYNEAFLNFGGDALVTGDDPIEFLGRVPIELPFAEIKPDSDRINITASLKDEALEIVNLFTDQVTLENILADIELEVKGTLLEPEPTGLATITGMTATAAAFPDPVTEIQGKVLFKGDRLEVETITGQLSEGEVTVTGVLPILTALGAGDSDIDKPLKIALNELNIDYQGFFQGDINGNVFITGAALSPIIGGDIAVSKGRVLLNEAAGFASQMPTEEVALTEEQFEIRLRDLEVALKNRLRMVSPGLVNFQVIGNLGINGTASNPEPSGVIDITGGTINLFSTDLRLDREYQNTATFIPSLGLDPFLDVRLKTSVLETTQFPTSASAYSSEVADAPALGNLGSSRKIRIEARVNGPASGLQNDLKLTSVPVRTDSQIISLLGGSIVGTLRDDSTLALANIAGTTLFSNIEQDVLEKTGLSEFRIFPARISRRGSGRSSDLGLGLEVGLDITNRLGVSVTQIFSANEPTEFSLRYRLSDRVLLRGGTNFEDNSVVGVEYQVQF